MARQAKDPLDGLDKTTANEILSDRFAIEKEIGQPICGHFLGEKRDGHWRVCTLPPKHTGLHH